MASTLGWPVRGWVQSPHCWLNSDTDEEWADRLDKGANRPFLHGLTERLRFVDESQQSTEPDRSRDLDPLSRLPSVAIHST